MKYFFSFFVISLLGGPLAMAYPENVRHGYTNCTACHLSPNGGSLLSAYGRGLSAELMSTWGGEEATKPLHGVVSFPEWLSLGGDLRFANIYSQSGAGAAQNIRFPMQMDFEAGLNTEDWLVAGSIGPKGWKTGPGLFVSRSHYVLYRFSDQINLRAGRFFPAYGWNQANHMLFVRNDLRFDQDMETYNFEISYIGDNLDVFVTALAGRPEDTTLSVDRGMAIRSTYGWGDNKKVGLGYYYGSDQSGAGGFGSRHVFGPLLSMGLPWNLSVLAEANLQYLTPPSAASQFGYVTFAKLNYQIAKGLHASLLHQYSNQVTSTDVKHGYGVGVQWFPYPHVEVDTLMTWFTRNGTPGALHSFILHYYL